MSKAKDFQLATAERIIDIFKSGQKRVLLSDEVGLGKTIMARTVVEMAKSLPGIEDDGVYRVVYVCSNQNIIQQNTRNLGIPKEDIMQMRESRLSMQHLILQERKIQQEAKSGNGLPQQLIPLTPSTSFSITGGAGNGAFGTQAERRDPFRGRFRIPALDRAQASAARLLFQDDLFPPVHRGYASGIPKGDLHRRGHDRAGRYRRAL